MKVLRLARFGAALVPLVLSIGLLKLSNLISGEHYRVIAW